MPGRDKLEAAVDIHVISLGSSSIIAVVQNLLYWLFGNMR